MSHPSQNGLISQISCQCPDARAHPTACGTRRSHRTEPESKIGRSEHLWFPRGKSGVKSMQARCFPSPRTISQHMVCSAKAPVINETRPAVYIWHSPTQLSTGTLPAPPACSPPASEIETSGCLQEGFISKLVALLERREIFHPFSYNYCLTRDDLQPDFEDFRLLSRASSLFKPPESVLRRRRALRHTGLRFFGCAQRSSRA